MRPTDIRHRLKDAALWERAHNEPLPQIQRRIEAMHRRARLLRTSVVAIALCSVSIGAFVVATMQHDERPSMEMRVSGLVGVAGTAEVFERASGYELSLSVDRVPERPAGSMFEVWLAAGERRLHLGSVNGPGDATMWSAVDPGEFDVVSISVGVEDPSSLAGGSREGEAAVTSVSSSSAPTVRGRRMRRGS